MVLLEVMDEGYVINYFNNVPDSKLGHFSKRSRVEGPRPVVRVTNSYVTGIKDIVDCTHLIYQLGGERGEREGERGERERGERERGEREGEGEREREERERRGRGEGEGGREEREKRGRERGEREDSLRTITVIFKIIKYDV